MPIHVQILINDRVLDTLHIGRLEGGMDPDDLNTYCAVLGEEPVGLHSWLDRGVTYLHTYGDGALVCVRKALEAIEKKETGDEQV